MQNKRLFVIPGPNISVWGCVSNLLTALYGRHQNKPNFSESVGERGLLCV